MVARVRPPLQAAVAERKAIALATAGKERRLWLWLNFHIATSTSAQAQCQPTIVCETYYFEVCKVQNSLDAKTPVGALAQRFLNCLTALQGLVYDPPVGR